MRAETTTANAAGDTWIISELPNNNMGGATDFAAGVNAHGSRMRGLIRFNLSGIPTNASVTSAVLTLNAVHAHFVAPNATFGVHRLLQTWGEGNRTGKTGLTALSGQATWNARLHSTANWTTAGASSSSDRTAAASATTAVSGLGIYAFGSTASMVADVQAWVTNPTSNYGWLLRDQAETTAYTARRWASKESGSGPTLQVTYTVPSAVATAPLLSRIVKTNNQLKFSFNAEANRPYTVQARAAVQTGTWAPVTNISASAVATNVSVTDTIAGDRKFYRVVTP